MIVEFNGTARELDPGARLADLVPAAAGVAAAVNGAVVPQGDWSHTRLSSGDVIDVVTAHQGG